MSGGEVAIETTAAIAGANENRLAMIPDRVGESARAPWLLYRGGTCLHAIAIKHVIEIMRILPVAAVADAPRYICGLCVIRGSPVPVVDIGLLVGGQAAPTERLVTIRTGSRMIALAVEGVLGIRDVGSGTLRQLPPLLGDVPSQAIDAIGILDAEMLFILHATRIVPEDVLDHLDIHGASS
jgi:purine-binding chemotaxis protein CheW